MAKRKTPEAIILGILQYEVSLPQAESLLAMAKEIVRQRQASELGVVRKPRVKKVEEA